MWRMPLSNGRIIVSGPVAGAKSFITKPFQPPKILETIQKVLA